MVTMRDIAAEAQVDRSTVSAVLSGSKTIRVSQKKRDQILAIAKKMNYHPNRIAQSLVSRSSHTIGVLLYSPRDRAYASLLDSFQQELLRRNYSGNFAFWQNENELKNAYDHALAHRVDGIITCHDDASLLPTDIPAIILGSEHQTTDCFYMEWEKIYQSYLHYLTSLGHKKILFLGGDEKTPRFLALKKAAAATGLPEIEQIPCICFQEYAFEAAVQVLSRSTPPRAIIAGNDMAALAVINAAHSLGLQVPRDLSVMGYDNIDEGKYSFPALTTSGEDFNNLAKKMLDTLFKRINHPDIPQQKTAIVSDLIIRGSCGKLIQENK